MANSDRGVSQEAGEEGLGGRGEGDTDTGRDGTGRDGGRHGTWISWDHTVGVVYELPEGK